ncbi:MAG: multicopper oxidase domain-containing protein [Thermoplasmata archaeon]|nr:multicopper oxidase domain-containing protein [Thermoplasmata archaeon]
MASPPAALAAPAPASNPTVLVVSLFIVGTLLAVGVGYLGEAGLLGGSIPGTYLPTGSAHRCEGRNAAATYRFVLIAGENGGSTFNGSSPGPCILVGAGSVVNVSLHVDPSAGRNQSWVLVAAGSPDNASPVFAGAGFSGPQRVTGIAPGAEASFLFTASTAGAFRYVSEAPGQAARGMQGWFNVTSLAAGPLVAEKTGSAGANGAAPPSVSPGAARLILG